MGESRRSERSPARIGDLCTLCGGRVGVLNTRVSGGLRVRWLGCPECGHRPPENKQVIPIEHAPPQRRRFSRREGLQRR